MMLQVQLDTNTCLSEHNWTQYSVQSCLIGKKLCPITRHRKYTRMELPKIIGDKRTRVIPNISHRNHEIRGKSCPFLYLKFDLHKNKYIMMLQVQLDTNMCLIEHNWTQYSVQSCSIGKKIVSNQ